MVTREDHGMTHDEHLKTREREAATLAILNVISESRHDEGPVLQEIVNTAARLCSAPFSCLFLCNEKRTHLCVAAHNGTRSKFIELMNSDPLPMDPEQSLSARVIAKKKPLQIEDFNDDPITLAGQRHRVHAVQVEGIRTLLAVPLMIEKEAVGVILLYRREVLLFTEDEIGMAETFAAQAVIAIENVKQFKQLKTRLDREAATREVLSVISQFRNDETPVFEAILENASRLCGAPHAFLQLQNEEGTHLEVAGQNFTKSKMFDLLQADPTPLHNNEGSTSVQTLKAAIPTHHEDIRLLEGTAAYTPQVKYAIEAEGIRTLLLVPLIADSKGIGLIMLYKQEVAPFSDDEISLVQTFAAQAVIAIDNVRQFKALEKLNTELGERVDEQVGEIERMARLKRFLPAAVADTVVSSGSEEMLKSHRSLLGVLFCDIRGFTAFCETAEPEETIEVLQTYHQEMGQLISAHSAGVDHRMGDGIMVLFNDPLPCDDPAGEAVRLAIAMRERMAELSAEWKKLGHRLGFGVGISLGYATVGMVGFEGRFDYTASGTAINLAARLCDEAKDGEILLSPRARISIEEDFQIESRGEISLKGIREPVEVSKVINMVAN